MIDPPRGDIIGPGGGYIQKSFVMSQVKISLGPVIGHVALPVFIRVKGTRVYINIGIKLLDGDLKAPGLQQFAQRSRNNALSE